MLGHRLSPSEVLAPPVALLPPQGCRGAVADWPRLRRALKWTSGGPVGPIHRGRGPVTSGPAGYGGPELLMRELAADPQALSRTVPALDLYAEFARITLRVATLSSAIARTLAAIPEMLDDAHAIRTDAVAPVARVVAELTRGADQIIGVVWTLASRLDGAVEAVAMARKERDAAAEHLERTAMLRSSSDLLPVGAAGSIGDASRVLEAADRTLVVASVIDHLERALGAMANGWRLWRDGLEGLDAAELVGADRWRDDLAVAHAADEWSDFSLQVRGFMPGLLVGRDGADRYAPL